VAADRLIPDELMRRASSCPRKAVTNFVREECSSYRALLLDFDERTQGRARQHLPRLRDLARLKVNTVISLHYAEIPCSCRHCPAPPGPKEAPNG